MDPITFLTGLTASLGAIALESLQRSRAKPEDYVIRVVHEWNDGWRASELLSPAAIEDVGGIFDVGVGGWWDLVQSGDYTVIVLSETSGDRHALAILRRVAGVWTVNSSFGVSYAKVQKHQRERLGKVARLLSGGDPFSTHHPDHPGDIALGQYVFTPILTRAQARIEGERLEHSVEFLADPTPGTIAYHIDGPGAEQGTVAIYPEPNARVEVRGPGGSEPSTAMNTAAMRLADDKHGVSPRRARLIEDAARAQEFFTPDELEEAARVERGEEEEYGAEPGWLYRVN